MVSGIDDQLRRQWTRPGQTLRARVNRRARDPPKVQDPLPTNSIIVRKQQHNGENNELVELSGTPLQPVSRGCGGSVNRLACGVMVAVAGMVVLGMTATLAGAQTHTATYPLNDVMQAPFAWDMLAAPTGTAVAWVFNAKGCSNIWVADPSHGAKARQITPYTEDDGFDIGELAWPPDAKSIAVRRGQ